MLETVPEEDETFDVGPQLPKAKKRKVCNAADGKDMQPSFLQASSGLLVVAWTHTLFGMILDP